VTDNSSVQTCFLYDGLGSSTELAAHDGSVTGAYAYDVFGPVRAHTGASTEWSYTGEQNDSTGLEYLRARYYDPAAGRFLSQDPLVLAGWSGHAFGYAGNDPLNLTDPLGLQPLPPEPPPGFVEYHGSWLTEAEMEWCNESWAHRLDCYMAHLRGNQAIEATETLFPDQWQEDNAADAWRHCYLGGLLDIQFGPEKAWGFIYRQEDFPNNLAPRKGMDLGNSYCGVLIGEKVKGLIRQDYLRTQWQALGYVCMIGISNGVLVTSLWDPRLW
jgi:RHS repeat-associated protein